MRRRGVALAPDVKDPYVNALIKQARNDRGGRMIDRLVLGAVIEARGCERFEMIAEGLGEGELAGFYRHLAVSEAQHQEQFLAVAESVSEPARVAAALDRWLDLEAQVLEALEPRPRLH